MAPISIDFTNVQDGFELIPKGKYNAKVQNIELKPGKEHPYFAWTFELTEGEFIGRKAFTNTSLSPKSLWKLKQIIKRVAPEVNVDGISELDPSLFIGKDCVLSIIVEPYEGVDRSKVADVLPPSTDNGLPFLT